MTGTACDGRPSSMTSGSSPFTPSRLNKPGKLDHYEWEIIKNHPLEGARLTAPLAGWLGEWANTIAEHHERYDGVGYPYGLKGEQISLGGRIVAVADSFDTMTTVRSYKTAMNPKAARAELAACAGSQFDPKVVRAFLDVSIGRLRPVAGSFSVARFLALRRRHSPGSFRR